METDLTYTNKAGISLQNVLDVLTADGIGKKDIQSAVGTEKSIDALLKKLETASLIKKKKDGNKLLYTTSRKKSVEKEKAPKKEAPITEQVEKTPKKKTTKNNKAPKKKETPKPVGVDGQVVNKSEEDVKPSHAINDKPNVVETPVKVGSDDAVEQTPAPKRTVIKAKPKRSQTPAEVKEINKQTESISKENQITSLVEIPDEEKVAKEERHVAKTNEIDASDLDVLKKGLESKLGKEVTAVLHKRKDRAIKQRKETAKEIYEKQQEKLSDDAEEYDKDNPFRFVLNFFTSTLNGEKATPYFRRRDEYVVKSIYNKFKSLCKVSSKYDITPQNLPFYRVITINQEKREVKMYHIDMNRIIRGQYTIFTFKDEDNQYMVFKD